MLDKIELKTAVWIYDIDNFRITWANQAALLWWESDSLIELQSRSFAQESSQAVKETLRDYQKKFYTNQDYIELWQFLPKGIAKEAYCRFSGILLPDKRMAMLVEATPFTVFYPLIHDHTIVTMATFNMAGQFQSCNPYFEKEFGKNRPSLTSLLGMPNLLPDLQHNIILNKVYEADLLLNSLSGNIWYRASFTASKDSSNQNAILCQLHNIDKRKKRELKLVHEAHTDALTGLLNRRGFTDLMQPILKGKKNTLVFYIDLDGFKMINDSLGHAIGDLVLKEVAIRLTALQYANIKCCRFGGDEFVISLPDYQSVLNIDDISAAIVNTLSEPYKDNHGNLIAVSASIGVARSPNDSDSLIELIRFADAAMYCSKNRGKKRSTLFIPGMEKEILRKSIVTQYLSHAIAKKELSLHYQPITNVNDNSPDCFEALLRWENPELGSVSPQELIEVAERTGLITDIENWVVETAISELKYLRKYTDSQATIAVNISSMHLVNTELLAFLLSTLAQHHLKPSDLVIEITESVLLDGLNANNNPLKAISSSGINISIDDFGTGYSSLAYLHNINAHSVKIDRDFIIESGNSVATLQAIHTLIGSLNMLSIVEGIETQNQAQNAANAGITLHQGYWYEKPKPLSAYKRDWTIKTDKGEL